MTEIITASLRESQSTNETSSQEVLSDNWLSVDQAIMLINAPDTSTLKGIRDRAILSVMSGAGLQCSEVAKLAFDHIQINEETCIITDIVGNYNKIRSIPIPTWIKAIIDNWIRAADLSEGRIFRSINKAGRFSGPSITPQSIKYVIKTYARKLGLDLGTNDLQRVFEEITSHGRMELSQVLESLEPIESKEITNQSCYITHFQIV